MKNLKIYGFAMVKKTTVIAISCFVVLSGFAIFGRASFKKSSLKQQVDKVAVELVAEPIKADPAKVKLLSEVYSKMSLNQNELFIAAKVNANNGADSTDRMDAADYIFSKKGNSFYYKLGAVETINRDGLSIYVDHGIKKIMISEGKTNAPLPALPDLSALLSHIAEEGYALSEKEQGETTTILLNNPNHVSCKTYSVSFNRKSLQPEKIFYRMSNFQEPENDKLDNLLEITFNKIEKHSGLERYPVQKFVQKEHGNWVSSAAYKDYELINML